MYISNIGTNNNHFRELDNKGNGVFEGEDVYIFGQEVYISTKQDNSYYYLVKYTTVRNPNSAVDASFPQSYSAPKNVLYLPLTSTLQIGKIYTFKIKCESCSKMAVVDGNNWTYLTKSGSIFSNQVKITGSIEVRIVNVNGNYYNIYYYYQTTK